MLIAIALVIIVSLATGAFAQAPRSGKLGELKQLSIEELVDTDVTTASRRIERLADVAAAVTVISSEDLRRMGVQTLAQALRLAGHLHVSQISGPQYGITARGFAISTANKMLVLLDGRTVYSPVFAGVFWETQDMSLLDIDRIEVIRGPGGSIWGANAVNGVINVITQARHRDEGHARQLSRRGRACSDRTRCDMAGASAAQARIERMQKSDSRTRISSSAARMHWTTSTSAKRASGSTRIRRAESLTAAGRHVYRDDRAFEHDRGQPVGRQSAGTLDGRGREPRHHRPGIFRSHLPPRSQSVSRHAQHRRHRRPASLDLHAPQCRLRSRLPTLRRRRPR